ncbi:dihydroorotase [Caulobacter sp. 17J65-9]|uniref:dihydroorotase n=1 Tax=Caulobacter sp. 17J65-9 TaxID=2709382 RepID=UPI0013C99F4B|nr:dihydroorotase [Caulobacter sp. 17J65-9]NEX94019.1 amidohydrolase family protein [Caulobacter sp. 17J65-9]
MKTAFVNARLVDPASGYDGPGSVLVIGDEIVQVAHTPTIEGHTGDTVHCGGAVLAPGLIDLRVKTGEPGHEPKETLKSAAKAAAAGGVSTVVLQPDTDPALDEPAMVDFVTRRARALGLVNMLVAGAATRGLEGGRIAELGLMQEAGAAYFTDADRVIVNTKVFRRILTYAKGFDALVAHRPMDPWLADGAVATASQLSGWNGLPAAPAVAERIMLERDLALAESVGARLLVDQISTADALDSLKRAKARGVKAFASCSINHLSFNEVDLGDYRTFFRLDPPLRPEEDRQALIEAVRDGLIDVIVSAHAPAPAEDKRRPFSEAAPGAIGVETLLPALMSLHHEAGLSLLEVLRPVTSAPASLLGLKSGRLAEGAPADLVLFDPAAPVVIDAAKLQSKSKNSPFDGRRLQGKVMRTVVGGRTVFGG